MAVDVLKSKGVPEERILFLNVIASPEGVNNFAKKFPKLRVVTGFIDQGLNEKKYVKFPSHRHQADILIQLHYAGTWGFWGPFLYNVTRRNA